MNFFAFKTAAERYSKGRPFFHPLVINHVKQFLSLTEPLARAIDVGCGTGLSSVALKEIAQTIVGLDAAPEMLAHASLDAHISYVVAVAELLPFRSEAFELMTLSQVSHWLDRRRFFTEARRVLRPNGWLIAYDAYFSAQAVEAAEFQAWHQSSYLKKYPSPPRVAVALTTEDVCGTGIQLRDEERLQHEIKLTHEQLVDYLLSQSNVIAQVEGGAESAREARRWLMESAEPFFARSAAVSFVFNIPIWYLQAEAS